MKRLLQESENLNFSSTVFVVHWLTLGQFRNSVNFLISKVELMTPVLSVLRGCVGIEYDNGCGRYSAARKPSCKVMLCEVFTGAAFPSLLPVTAAHRTHTWRTGNCSRGFHSSWKKHSDRNHKLRQWCQVLITSQGKGPFLLFFYFC